MRNQTALSPRSHCSLTIVVQITSPGIPGGAGVDAARRVPAAKQGDGVREGRE